MPKIYIDLDGVLANFGKGAKDLVGTNPDTDGVELNNKQKTKIFREVDFFTNLEMMPGAKQMVEKLREYGEIAILSSTGHTDADRIGGEKRGWVKRHFGDIHTITVPKSGDKANYASPDAILIDDRTKSTEPFAAAGGHAVLHKSVNSTLLQVDQLVKDL